LISIEPIEINEMDKKTVLLKKLSSSLAPNGAREMTGRSEESRFERPLKRSSGRRGNRSSSSSILEEADPSIFPGPTRWWRS